ncbi:MAG: FAD-dependent oxidoreductase, partial [Coriobacteriaceae bacterium]|nr:FAD-dependent oxidoreductase [Coriobacteriaceae bacterium]
MARLHVMQRSDAQAVMDGLHEALGRRLAVSSLAPCPVEFTAAYVNMCATQSCGKCTPCRVGLRALSDLLNDVLENRADEHTLDLIERTARTIFLSADCAIGYEAGDMALTAIRGFRDDFEHHVRKHACGFTQSQLVPCVSGCPAGVDIPGYISLVEAGRHTDAVRLIRKDNPLPLVCGYVCEHPCEMNCRRGMVDDPMNIRGLKRFAVDHMETDYRPHMAERTGRRVAVVGGGPAGLSCAYYLATMGHDVTIYEARHKLGGMLRYGIPNYRLPHERLDAEIQWILDCGIRVKRDTKVEDLVALRNSYDAVYLAIGAHLDRKLGLHGEDSVGVLSAVEMLRALGDEVRPDFSHERVCVIGGGNVAM